MNLTKQTRDGLLLGVALLVLFIVAYLTLKGNDTTPTAPPVAQTPPAANRERPATETNDEMAAPGVRGMNARGSALAMAMKLRTSRLHAASPLDPNDPLAWVRPERIPQLVAEVRGGRDPFKDLRLPPPPAPASMATHDDKKLKPLPATEAQHSKMVALEGVAPDALQKACAQAGLAVTVHEAARPDMVALTGTKSELARAMEILKDQQLLAIPPFVLVGVMVMNGYRNYALLTAGDKQYGVYEGDLLPDVGWTVRKITSTSVSLVRGTQQLQLRLAGGKVS